MAQRFTEITDRLARFIEAQQLFFVATAARDGRVNVSPKGLDSLRITSPTQVVWVNGRAAATRPPRICWTLRG